MIELTELIHRHDSAVKDILMSVNIEAESVEIIVGIRHGLNEEDRCFPSNTARPHSKVGTQTLLFFTESLCSQAPVA